MEFQLARELADQWVECLRPYCERVEIAGSVRRGKTEVHDIEIVAAPRFDEVKDWFGPRPVNRLLVALNTGILHGRKVKGGEKYWQVAMREGINLDLFMVIPPAQWGIIFTLRTGPVDFSHWIVTHKQKGGAMPSYARCDGGQLWVGDKAIPVLEEIDFLEFLGLGWIEPGEREAKWKVRAAR